MTALVAEISSMVTHGPRAHLTIARAVATAAEQLSPLYHVDERAVRVAIGRAMADLVDEPVASSATSHEATLHTLPFWEASDHPGPFDLVIGDESAPRLAAEVKWSSTNTLSHSLWDILKLIAALALSAEQVYLIAGYPNRVWNTTPFSTLFDDGVVAFTELPLAKEWSWLLAHSKGTPTRIPNEIDITDVCRVTLTHTGEPWQIRTVAIDPGPAGWLQLIDGQLAGSDPTS